MWKYLACESDDLKGLYPRDIVKLISDEVDENISKSIKLFISKDSVDDSFQETQDEYESLEYIPLGEQSDLQLKKLLSFGIAYRILPCIYQFEQFFLKK